MIKREKYLNYLIECRDLDLIKVITGIRRSGKSMLLMMYKEYLIKENVSEKNIIHMNFESGLYDEITNYKELYNYIKDKIQTGKNYIFLDEVQLVENFEKCVNALRVDFDVDIYITGSNAYLLSGELSTLLSGRYLEIKMHPLSFEEFIIFNKDKDLNIEKLFLNYLRYGGMPNITYMNNNELVITNYLSDIYNSVVKKDIIDRNSIRDISLLEKVIKFLAANIGSKISPSSISGYLVSNKIVEKSSHITIDNYLTMFEKSFIFYKVDRYDLRSKELLKTLGKYYISDIGIRNNLLGFKNIDEGHILENIVYLELLRRGYKISIGKIDEYEIDFIAENMYETKYIQVAQSIKNVEVYNREVRSLKIINDNYDKIIITNDTNLSYSDEGIKFINIIDFLCE